MSPVAPDWVIGAIALMSQLPDCVLAVITLSLLVQSKQSSLTVNVAAPPPSGPSVTTTLKVLPPAGIDQVVGADAPPVVSLPAVIVPFSARPEHAAEKP